MTEQQAYRYAGINELRAALRSGQVSAQELAENAVSLLETVGARYNAVAAIMRPRAQSEAAQADRRLADGRAPALCGIPYAAKDLFAAKGAPTTWGNATFKHRVFERDATVIRRLSADGAVLTAKLAMSELAGGGMAGRPGASMHGSGRNPWDPSRYSGGSSSGSAIAVAIGAIPFALGTETGGSILGPSAFSGVTGLRPTFGLVPRDGAMTLSWTLDKIGPLARSATDCSTVLDAMSYRNRARRAQSGHGGPDEGRDLSKVQIAFSEAEFAEATPSIRKALVDGIESLRRLFPRFVDAELRRDAEHIRALEEIVRIEGAFEFRNHLRSPDFAMADPQQQASLTSGLSASAADYLQALRVSKPAAARALREVFARCEVVVSASRPSIAPLLDGAGVHRDPTKMSDLLRAAGNLAGVPGVSFPCGLSDEGLPVGLQLVGPRGSDELLLAIADVFQSATDHHLKHPPE